MKLLVLLSTVFAISELQRAASSSGYKCQDFIDGGNDDTNYDKFCYESKLDLQHFCIGQAGYADIECNDLNEGIQLLFGDSTISSPMRFNKKGEEKCQNYHTNHLKPLAWSLGYSNYRVDGKVSGNGCNQVALDKCGAFKIVKNGGSGAARFELPINVTFWGSFSKPTCDDGQKNQCETGVDCGGPCPACATCTDEQQNQGETDIDCGGPCAACPTCNDGIQNQEETGLDCGGPCDACPTCNDGIQNQEETGLDCGGPCAACPTCNDGIQNQEETGLDCGGPCAACPTCDDGIQNQEETGLDCGGPCAACPTCDDGIQNQEETGLDCGGPCPTTCPDACEKFNGIFGDNSGKAACCNKKCPKCGGKNCGKLRDDKGKKLGSNHCCIWKIRRQDKKCGSKGQEAPCKL